ncbi:MAG TPA: hypothetical protein VGB12_09655 [bacterium]|jgi:uncharacterized membrane protein
MKTDRPQTLAIAVLLALFSSPAVSLACSTCFGAPDDPMTKGLGMALWVMIGVTYFVIVGMLAMFIGLAVRSRRRTTIAQSGGQVAC